MPVGLEWCKNHTLSQGLAKHKFLLAFHKMWAQASNSNLKLLFFAMQLLCFSIHNVEQFRTSASLKRSLVKLWWAIGFRLYILGDHIMFYPFTGFQNQDLRLILKPSDYNAEGCLFEGLRAYHCPDPIQVQPNLRECSSVQLLEISIYCSQCSDQSYRRVRYFFRIWEDKDLQSADGLPHLDGSGSFWPSSHCPLTPLHIGVAPSARCKSFNLFSTAWYAWFRKRTGHTTARSWI